MELENNMSDNATKIKTIIANSLRIDASQITAESSLSDDLKADSLTQVEIAMELENEFNVKIPEDDAANFKTVGDIIEYCDKITSK